MWPCCRKCVTEAGFEVVKAHAIPSYLSLLTCSPCHEGHEPQTSETSNKLFLLSVAFIKVFNRSNRKAAMTGLAITAFGGMW